MGSGSPVSVGPVSERLGTAGGGRRSTSLTQAPANRDQSHHVHLRSISGSYLDQRLLGQYPMQPQPQSLSKTTWFDGQV